jgi:hypothetical protein
MHHSKNHRSKIKHKQRNLDTTHILNELPLARAIADRASDSLAALHAADKPDNRKAHKTRSAR